MIVADEVEPRPVELLVLTVLAIEGLVLVAVEVPPSVKVPPRLPVKLFFLVFIVSLVMIAPCIVVPPKLPKAFVPLKGFTGVVVPLSAELSADVVFPSEKIGLAVLADAAVVVVVVAGAVVVAVERLGKPGFISVWARVAAVVVVACVFSNKPDPLDAKPPKLGKVAEFVIVDVTDVPKPDDFVPKLKLPLSGFSEAVVEGATAVLPNLNPPNPVEVVVVAAAGALIAAAVEGLEVVELPKLNPPKLVIGFEVVDAVVVGFVLVVDVPKPPKPLGFAA